MNRTITAAAVTATAALAIGAGALPASASTPKPHYYANDVKGTGRFGTPVTGDAQQALATLTARYHRDPAEFVQAAKTARFTLPGGVAWLIAHPDRWTKAADAFGAYLRASVREEVRWTSPYRTEFAVPHGSRPTTFGWTSMPDLTRDVLVFDAGGREFELVMDCGGQPYLPPRPIPLPSRPRPVTCEHGKHGKHGKGGHCTAPCQPGQHLFNVPGVGAMCLCPTTVHVIVSSTRTVSVQVITTVTNTTSTTTTVSYGVCPKHKKCSHK